MPKATIFVVRAQSHHFRCNLPKATIFVVQTNRLRNPSHGVSILVLYMVNVPRHIYRIYLLGNYPAEVLGKVRYCLNILLNTPLTFGTNSIPVPDTSVSSVRQNFPGHRYTLPNTPLEQRGGLCFAHVFSLSFYIITRVDKGNKKGLNPSLDKNAWHVLYVMGRREKSLLYM